MKALLKDLMCLGTTWYQLRIMQRKWQLFNPLWLQNLLAMRISLEVLCEQATKGRSGGGGNVHPKGESSVVVPGLDVSSEPGGSL